MLSQIRSRPALFAYGLGLVVLILDQWSKAYILSGLKLVEGVRVPVLPFMNFTLVWNKGISFGGLRSDDGGLGRWMLVAFAFFITAALIYWAYKNTRPILVGAIGLLIGGALGNVIDRIRFAAVVDFLDFSKLFFPWVFNLADSAITVGVLLLIWDVVQTGEFLPVGSAPQKE